MPLMAAYEQNDARDSARLLATMTLDGLRHTCEASLVGNAINNMYRLLRDYRAHGFYGYVEEHRTDDETSMTSLLTSSERNVGTLKVALDQTFSTVFHGENPADVIDGMKQTLRMTAYPKDGESPDPAEQARLEQFFSTLVEKLQA